VIATFNNARQQEGCTGSLSIDPAVYDAATPQVQELMLVNAERQDRGLPPLQLDTTLLSQIDLNHSSEMVQYNYFAHSSPINQPGGQNDPQARLTINPAINGHWDGWAGNIAGGGTADTQPPTLNPPTIVDANTVQVTNVHDDSDGNTTGATGVTGVVFYVGSAVDQSGNFLTVVAKQGPATPGTWTATLAATDLSTLHAVAVDGSGNYNDCVGNAHSC
jgi:hypothetical protein